MSNTEQDAQSPKGTRAQSSYLSYLLRLYRINDENPAWRMSLESSLEGEPIGFASLDELVEFLRRKMGLIPQADQDEL
jgi:hypothetical protein